MTVTAGKTRLDSGHRVGKGVRKGTNSPHAGYDVGHFQRYTITPTAIASTAVCAGQAAAAAGNLSINGTLASGGVATLDVPRAVTIFMPGTEAAVNFTVYGTDVEGQSLVWTTAGDDAGSTTSAKTFKTVTRVAVDTATSSSVTVGSADVFGLPVRATKFSDVIINYNNTLITAVTGFTAGDATTASGTTGDVRGKYAVQSAADAAKVLDIKIFVVDPDTSDGLSGVDQYSG